MKLIVASKGFEQHTANAFSRLLNNADLSDVTLVADDMTKLPAHRFILSASSPFFASLLQEKQPGHALLFLGGLSIDLLQALISFIYLGKVEVEEQHMKQFTKMLRDFKVLDQHLKGQDDYEAKLEAGLPEPDHLKIDYKSDSDDSIDKFEVDDDGVKDDAKPVEPKKKALQAQVQAEPKCKHTQGFLDKKVARLQALTCSYCSYRAKRFGRLESHTRRVHQTEWPCDQCGQVLRTEVKLKKHIFAKHERIGKKIARLQALTCSKCQFRAKSFERLESHTRKFHETGLPCEHCGYICRTEGRLKMHIFAKHESTKIKGKCDVPGCDFVSPYPGKLNMHKRKEHGGEKFYCDQCDFSNWKKHTVENHKAAKHEGKLHHCDQCDAAYPYEAGLRTHKAIVHDGKRIYCPHCDYKATTNSNLRIHVEAKHEGKRFHCDLCDWTSSQAGAVRLHKRKKHDIEELCFKNV